MLLMRSRSYMTYRLGVFNELYGELHTAHRLFPFSRRYRNDVTVATDLLQGLLVAALGRETKIDHRTVISHRVDETVQGANDVVEEVRRERIRRGVRRHLNTWIFGLIACHLFSTVDHLDKIVSVPWNFE